MGIKPPAPTIMVTFRAVACKSPKCRCKPPVFISSTSNLHGFKKGTVPFLKPWRLLVDEMNTGGLQRHFGLLHATALNVTMIVGAGGFIPIPLMLKEFPGPYALLGWLAPGPAMLVA